jgi:hypothetical protein
MLQITIYRPLHCCRWSCLKVLLCSDNVSRHPWPPCTINISEDVFVQFTRTWGKLNATPYKKTEVISPSRFQRFVMIDNISNVFAASILLGTLHMDCCLSWSSLNLEPEPSVSALHGLTCYRQCKTFTKQFIRAIHNAQNSFLHPKSRLSEFGAKLWCLSLWFGGFHCLWVGVRSFWSKWRCKVFIFSWVIVGGEGIYSYFNLLKSLGIKKTKRLVCNSWVCSIHLWL